MKELLLDCKSVDLQGLRIAGVGEQHRQDYFFQPVSGNAVDFYCSTRESFLESEAGNRERPSYCRRAYDHSIADFDVSNS